MNPQLIEETRQRMQKVLDVIKNDLATVRTGRATPSLVENISVSVYGGTTRMKIIELAHVSSSDTQTLLITPYDQTVINELNKGIMEANIGLTPVVDGQLIRISIPPLSQERREELVSLVGQKLEAGRIQVRQLRHDGMAEIKKSEKDSSEDEVAHLEKEVQRVTDETMKQIDELGDKKRQELMQV